MAAAKSGNIVKRHQHRNGINGGSGVAAWQQSSVISVYQRKIRA